MSSSRTKTRADAPAFGEGEQGMALFLGNGRRFCEKTRNALDGSGEGAALRVGWRITQQSGREKGCGCFGSSGEVYADIARELESGASGARTPRKTGRACLPCACECRRVAEMNRTRGTTAFFRGLVAVGARLGRCVVSCFRAGRDSSASGAVRTKDYVGLLSARLSFVLVNSFSNAELHQVSFCPVLFRRFDCAGRFVQRRSFLWLRKKRGL